MLTYTEVFRINLPNSLNIINSYIKYIYNTKNLLVSDLITEFEKIFYFPDVHCVHFYNICNKNIKLIFLKKKILFFS